MKTGLFRPILALSALTMTLTATAALAGEGQPVPAELPAPPDGKGQVIFWRPSSFVGGAMGCGVNLGTERISALGNGRYFLVNMDPGTYEFNAKSEAKDVLTLEVEDGETSYVRCTIRMGILVGRPNLAPSSQQEFDGKKEKLKYVDSDDIGPKVSPDPATATPATDEVATETAGEETVGTEIPVEETVSEVEEPAVSTEESDNTGTATTDTTADDGDGESAPDAPETDQPGL